MFESPNVAPIKMVAILMMSAKLGTLGLLRIKVTGNNCYDVIIFVHGVASKVLSRQSKFGNSTIFMTEVVITSVV